MSIMEPTNISKETLKSMLEKNKRFDGRGSMDFRNVEIELNISNKAEGSARVRLGKTEVLAGIKLAPGNPYPDSLDKGNLMVSGDLTPLASPHFESGPPGFAAIELPRLLDRAIRESGMIDLKKLVIRAGEKVWTVFIDVYPINDDGNLLDVSLIACVVALKKTMIPNLKENDLPDYKTPSKTPLPISEETFPLSFSFFKFGNYLAMDPTREEEEMSDVRINFGISKWNGQYMINSSQKSGSSPFSRAELEKIAEILPQKFDEINERIKNYL
ncbi:RNA-binding protein [Candidatus Pacearchaeota archaeon CG10_big_fil_rev_8_21_14_0_10_31_24]|nr:MAG: RNA-binding protein [Candidatus Pacearchaeota archaeon CG10_big_fil_rev_8_21_14_0_10_31_24]